MKAQTEEEIQRREEKLLHFWNVVISIVCGLCVLAALLTLIRWPL